MSHLGYPIVFGTLEEEQSFMHEFSGDKCSLSGAIGIDNAARFTHLGLGFQIHRGEEGAGIVSFDGKDFKVRKTTGRLTDLIGSKESILDYTAGRVSISQGRYATSGGHNDDCNVQPTEFDTRYGKIYVAHNGNLVEQEDLKLFLKKRGVSEYKTDSDSELFGQMIASSKCDNLEDAIVEACRKIPAAYSYLVMTENQIYAIRDRFGVRPLSYGNIGKGYFVSSENYFYDSFEPRVLNQKEVPRGSIVVLEENKEPRIINYDNTNSEEHFCAFELLYFASAYSKFGGDYAFKVRESLGEKMFERIKHRIDLQNSIAVPILNSGRHFTIGLAKNSVNLEYLEAIKRIQNGIGDLRSFTSTANRRELLRMKHLIIPDLIDERDIYLGDDTICRGNTSKEIVQLVREAGAKSVHMQISGPPIINGCLYGINLKGSGNELIFNQVESEDEVARLIGADSVTYNTLEDLESVVKNIIGKGVCMGCMGGRDPTRVF